jgi:hypothetical protein
MTREVAWSALRSHDSPSTPTLPLVCLKVSILTPIGIFIIHFQIVRPLPRRFDIRKRGDVASMSRHHLSADHPCAKRHAAIAKRHTAIAKRHAAIAKRHAAITKRRFYGQTKMFDCNYEMCNVAL